ncbi:palmitoyltransferase ZDHHC23 isoform X1 [Drosophila teissieri]|uniref:palmitoyltransferase ZDHHC23 isoform X1 n=2 Tax=Drosophila teissieri TaxID=7243 RepID=UPI001CBA4CA9|nr:palmitoyltransferase ZDHHC23 isoform X1 [Drosophila teissieri]
MFLMSAGSSDFVSAAWRSEAEESKREETGSLCCCEYVAEDSRQRSHILGCCCNCVDFDLVCTRLVTCRAIDRRNIDGMLIAFQDRLRLPWRGGAKRISPAAVAPAFIVPLMLGLATLNSKTAIVLMLTLVGFTIWGMELAKRTATRTNFFLSWLVFSVFYMIIIFEFQVPLLELAPEENYALMFFSCAALYCLYSTKALSPLNLVSAQYGTTPKDELPGIAEASSGEEQAEAQTTLQMESVLSLDDDEVVDMDTAERSGLMHGQPNICEICRKVTPRRAYHCPVCGTCVKRRDHHSYWLNCCIGERNYVWYIVGLALSEIALLLGANLTLTSICHPFMVVRPLGYPVLLPDDCSEVFEGFELGISFVVACYALLISVYIAFILSRQAYLWWKGSTLHEYKRASNAAGRNRIWSNWRAILK